jgi:putative CocE/NonD family hydrolase
VPGNYTGDRVAASRKFLIIFVGIATGSFLAVQTRSQIEGASGIREEYVKSEYRIPMRDGKRLFTAVYAPRDRSRSYPFLMTRTPYSVAPYGASEYRRSLGPSEEFQKSGYIFVYQDVRGRYMSEGTFLEMNPHIDNKKTARDVDDSSDAHDTIDWLLKNVPNNNGKVGIWGISYPGFYTSASIIDSHPAIKAASPEAPITDLFMGDDAYHGGAFMLAANFGFYVDFEPQAVPTLPPKDSPRFDYGTRDGYQFYLKLGALDNAERYFKGQNPLWDDQVAHDTYDDYWKVRNLEPHLRDIHCAVLTVAGWFDAEDLAGPFKVYRSIEAKDPGTFNGLVVGPWVHGGWARYDGYRLGDVTFGSNTGQLFRTEILFPFFEHYLKNAADPQLPKAYVIETGSNEWRKYPSWPPKAETRTLYFRDGGGLSFDAPPAGKSSHTYDEYVSDPNRPVPFLAYPAVGVPQEYMDSDQRFAATRPDVLVYETEPLDRDVTIVGPVSPRLFVSTTGTDSDFVVKLIDVYPDTGEEPPRDESLGNDVGPPRVTMAGYEQLVRGEPMRGKFRKSFERPEPFTPGQVEEVDFTMPDINHAFLRGHRIMVQVQSSWFPLVDRNPQKFENIPDAKPSDFGKAVERIYRGTGQSSGVVVHVLR